MISNCSLCYSFKIKRQSRKADASLLDFPVGGFYGYGKHKDGSEICTCYGFILLQVINCRFPYFLFQAFSTK